MGSRQRFLWSCVGQAALAGNPVLALVIGQTAFSVWHKRGFCGRRINVASIQRAGRWETVQVDLERIILLSREDEASIGALMVNHNNELHCTSNVSDHFRGNGLHEGPKVDALQMGIARTPRISGLNCNSYTGSMRARQSLPGSRHSAGVKVQTCRLLQCQPPSSGNPEYGPP